MKKDKRHVVPDTSCLVPLLCQWHEHHSTTAHALDAYLERGFDLALAAHSLIETYAVLTRLPAPYRMSPEATADLLGRSLRSNATILTLTARETWQLVDRAPAAGASGGRTYDALIAASAQKVESPVLLTWNIKHFLAFESPTLSVATPEARPSI